MVDMIQNLSIVFDLDLYVFKTIKSAEENLSFEVMTVNNSTPFELYKAYSAIEQTPPSSSFTTHNLYLNITGSNLPNIMKDSGCEITFFVYDQAKKQQISHKHILQLNHMGKWSSKNSNNTSTTFTNLTNGQLNSSLYLVCQVVKIGITSKDIEAIEKTGFKAFRRRKTLDNNIYSNVKKIVGYSCFSLSKIPINRNTDPEKNAEEYIWDFSVPCENDQLFSKFEWLDPQKELELKTGQSIFQNQMLSLQIALFGINDQESNICKNSLFQTSRIGIMNSIQPSFGTNSIYITLNEGISPSRKNIGRNIQVIAQVRKIDGVFLSCISRGEPSESLLYYDSVVYQQNLNPFWNETFRIDLNPEDMMKSHLFLTFRNCNPTESMDIDRNIRNFAFAFM